MKTGVLTMALAFAATFAFLSLAGVSGAGTATDTDTDGFQDNIDNCPAISNASQNDTDQDGFGNRCDPDADQNGLVGGTDFGTWKGSLGKGPGDAGYNEDIELDEPPNALVGGTDFGIWKGFLGLAPGPGRPCANALIDVDDSFEGANDGAATFSTLGSGDAASVGCPDTRRRGTFSQS